MCFADYGQLLPTHLQLTIPPLAGTRMLLDERVEALEVSRHSMIAGPALLHTQKN